jgi:serine-type D-Ala-D-Ala carboxypeptidase (penicillin-binding protein 5/6)
MSPREPRGQYDGAGLWPRMRSLHLIRRLSQRQRRVLAATLGIAFLVVVVVANQPSAGSLAHPQARAAAAHQLGRVQSVPRSTPVPLLNVVKQHVAFEDATAQHSGAPAVQADTGILVDTDTGAILWARNPHQPHAPASTTKVLSSLVALQNFSPDRVVEITGDALHQAGDETRMGLAAGNQLTVRELLEGMLLVSGNDAADAMAVDTVGMESFVATMNHQVEALGLHDSHFVTPVGLDDPAQKASAYDLAAIASVDVTHFPVFRQIVAQTDVTLPASPLHPEFDLGNLNRLLRIYPAADGIKPGWTGDAGACLIGMAERDGHRLISVLLGAPQLYTDSRALLDWGFVQEGLPSLLPTPTPKKP